MLLRIVSDLHNDIYRAIIPKLSTDSETVLILAGDICEFKKPSSFNDFFGHLKGRFKKILYVPGNHEYYGGSLTCGVESFYKRLKHDLPELVILDQSVIEIDGIKFIGATLWSDFDNFNPISMFDVGNQLNDYKLIRYGSKEVPYSKRITPAVIGALHLQHKQFIKDNVDSNSVVITHHAPTRLSIHKKFKNDPLNGGYVSNLDDLIFEKQPKLWVHGHMHDSFEYNLDSTKVICNPRGYCIWAFAQKIPELLEHVGENIELYKDCFRDQNSGYDPYLLVDI